MISWDELSEADNSDASPLQDAPPAMTFDRTWAASIIQRVLARLKIEYARLGKTHQFDILRTFLPGGTATFSHENAADKLAMNRAALDLALHRFKKRFGKMLREEVVHTVSSPEEVDDEIRYLVTAWAAGT